MPADRRAFTATKPVKTERTHEENQERAYIAASRRSDRSLEARIESARRASEIHKKRTGRALRVTEQDVINEEMYEEEDDDLPTQYQRLNAHLQTSSVMFNRKLHDYIATQHGVRNMFLSQYQNLPFQPYGAANYPHVNGIVNQNQSMLPPQTFNPSAQAFSQSSQPYSPQAFQPQQQQQGYRQSPYHIPQRPYPHQRSASIPTPQATPTYPPQQQTDNTPTPGTEANRRLSLPPQALEQTPQTQQEGQSRPSISRATTSQTVQPQPTSPQAAQPTSGASPSSTKDTPLSQSPNATPASYPMTPTNYDSSSQVVSMNPLSMSLPPESQQLIGSVLDPNDPRTAIFMAGSNNLAQPFPTYSYNPNISPKTARDSGAISTSNNSHGMSTLGMSQTLAPTGPIKLETSVDNASSTAPPSAWSDSMLSPNSLFTPSGFEYQTFFDSNSDLNHADGEAITHEPLNEEDFFNFE